MAFVDTNVLLYAISRDPAESAKAATANTLLAQRDIVLSTQILGEFFVQATRSSRADRLTADQARRLVESFTRFRVVPITESLVISSMACAARWQLSYWDAAVVEACRASGGGVLWTEDLNHGQDYGGVVVQNPFVAEA